MWKIDGEDEGVVKVKNFYAGPENIYMLKEINHEVYFLVSDGNYRNLELWKTDGTETGTILIKQISDVLNSNSIVESHELNNMIYFSFLSGSYQIWRTDGTACGTYKIDSRSENPNMVRSGSTIFLSGIFENLGTELLKINEDEIIPPSCLPIARELSQEIDDDSEFQVQEIVSAFPNPYNHEFSFRVKGSDNETYGASVINMKGELIESHANLKCNVDYNFGSAWRSGMYLLKANTKNRTITKKVLKID
jgi:ELWxxDGT repeat protein